MSDPHWTSYVGMVTGIAGSILGVIGYLTSKRHKSQDLRIELKKSLSSSNILVREIIKFMKKTHGSKIAIDAANGRSTSGGSDAWEKELEKDKTTVGELGNKLAIDHKSINSMTDKDLEKNLVEVHRIQTLLKSVNVKYIELENQIKEQVKVRGEIFQKRYK